MGLNAQRAIQDYHSDHTCPSDPGIPAMHASSAAAMAPHNILIVEDCSSTRLVMMHYLNSMNFNVHTAHCGEHAIGLSRQHPFDIVFMDVSLPGIDGHETIRILKRDPRLSNCRFVIFSGYTASELPPHSYEVLAKPVTRSTLSCCLQRLLGYSYFRGGLVPTS